ncbi:MAG: hypothetical protein KKE62_18240 [Proteobacteria bacterium]|nr:hypothetical protein [Pseudomonadota bacterium]MBU1389213.1 hypothetical protein [Pseudomonadota bacterium]MBU1544777.1 hypothetical protein [Pseudomonadota bacterium]MBU2429977.1 hypothetical protein [Pseudomonadota bacterium]MBU2481881.1 hypothetical protein [Pseudomonadota bacterium]
MTFQRTYLPLQDQTERTIIHLNIADFAACVETNLAPELTGYPLVIAPLGASRAIVHDMSEEAFAQGIRKGMPLARAKRINKKINVLPPRFNRYEQIMKHLFKKAAAFTPLIETGTADGHIYLDVTGSCRLFGPGVDMAFKLKTCFKKEFNLNPVWSVAPSKLLAKVATRIAKPSGEYIVAPGDEQAFLDPLPIHLLPGLETSDIKIFHQFNLTRIDQARHLTIEQLKIPFEHRAVDIYTRLQGIDTEPVTLSDPLQKITRTAIMADHEFENDTNDAAQLKKGLYLICENLCCTLRQKKLAARTVVITISYSDGIQRQARAQMSAGASIEPVLFRHALDLLNTAWSRRIRIRHLRLDITRLVPDSFQGDLFSDHTEKLRQSQLIQTMDRIREKFGQTAIHPGLILARETG